MYFLYFIFLTSGWGSMSHSTIDPFFCWERKIYFNLESSIIRNPLRISLTITTIVFIIITGRNYLARDTILEIQPTVEDCWYTKAMILFISVTSSSLLVSDTPAWRTKLWIQNGHWLTHRNLFFWHGVNMPIRDWMSPNWMLKVEMLLRFRYIQLIFDVNFKN